MKSDRIKSMCRYATAAWPIVIVAIILTLTTTMAASQTITYPDWKDNFTTMTAMKTQPEDEISTEVAWKRIVLTMSPDKNAIADGQYSRIVTPGKFQLALKVPSVLRDEIKGVVFRSVWVNTAGGPRTIQALTADDIVDNGNSELIIRVDFQAPVIDLYHIWAEAVDKDGARYYSCWKDQAATALIVSSPTGLFAPGSFFLFGGDRRFLQRQRDGGIIT
jgi:hypothetical protein